ncbi:hypothetical protein NT6N_29960 [Oceaniferula spumae]|uniref:PPM-type phosphatase domain-containing protein n=1 Tax=Oceaniferula spumae TaxID=2979115 RepID=A0AAT9FPN4_9BACT
MRLKYKLSLALVLVAAVPIAIVVLVLQQLGYRHLLAERGQLYRTEADAAARNLSLSVDREVSQLRSLLRVSTVVDQVLTSTNETASKLTDEQRRASELEVEKSWVSLTSDSERLQTILQNPLAQQLREFQVTNPLANEIFITDRYGRVIASTVKTTDYIQSDELWWQQGAKLKENDVWFDQFHLDDSAGVYSLDIVLPIHDNSGELTGVMKAVFNVAPLFAAIPPPLDGRADQVDVTNSNGAVLARINQPDYKPLSVSLSTAVMKKASNNGSSGWFLTTDDTTENERMYGTASTQFGNISDQQPQIYIVVSIDADEVTVPIKKQLRWILLGSTLALLLSLAAVLFYVRSRITGPLELLRDGAQSISESARLRQDEESAANRKQAHQVVEGLREIKTGDEIEELATGFATMGSRVLRYHRHLESEVAAKTALIHQDLEMAKEFQEAMLPGDYPKIPSGPHTGEHLKLHFWHLYQPADTLGGDFFDMFQISEHRAGLFIADVMGHGARSALVTAILRALLPGLVEAAADPGIFMEQLNQHFLDIMERSGQTIFVTAFFIVLDTKDETATYVTAGHPSPVYTNRSNGDTDFLFKGVKNQPALGLIPGAEYTAHTRSLLADDVFLLFTDGLIEAENAAGEMFGDTQLLKAVHKYRDLPVDSLSHAVVAALGQFTQNKAMEDDLCLVTVEATGAHSQ